MQPRTLPKRLSYLFLNTSLRAVGAIQKVLPGTTKPAHRLLQAIEALPHLGGGHTREHVDGETHNKKIE
eukprot:5231523-Pleurochrysis_carterae.AAC.1